MDLPEVKLITMPLGGDTGTERVVAVMVGEERLEVPEGSRVAVEYEAGLTSPVVHVEILAARVRYVADGGQAQRLTSELVPEGPIEPGGPE